MDRDNPQYQRNKTAWDLVASKQWRDYLKPMLEERSKGDIPNIYTLNDSIEAARIQERKKFIKSFIAEVERHAKTLEQHKG